MNDKKRRPVKKRGSGRAVQKSPYFLQPAKQGAVTVLRRPAGNRIDAKLCGTMNSRAMAIALVKQLERAESVVKDLFLEATDDGIEALEAVLEACRQSVIQRGDSIDRAAAAPREGGAGRGAPRSKRRGRRKGPRQDGAQSTNSAPDGGAEDTSAA
jgi:hypothetical protein